MFNTIQFSDDNGIIFTGVMVSHEFESNAEQNEVTVSGYSTTGILNDCQVPVSAYPIQIKNKSVEDVAKTICSIFNVELVIDSLALSDASVVLSRTEISPNQKAGEYLSSICALKNLILSHTSRGELLITKINVNQKPIAYLQEGDAVITSLSLSVNGQDIHRTIYVMGQQGITDNIKSQASLTNIMVDVWSKRSSLIEQTRGDGNQSLTAVRQALANELKNITVRINIRGWYLNDILPVPGNSLKLLAKSIFLYDNILS